MTVRSVPPIVSALRMLKAKEYGKIFHSPGMVGCRDKDYAEGCSVRPKPPLDLAAADIQRVQGALGLAQFSKDYQSASKAHDNQYLRLLRPGCDQVLSPEQV